MSAQSRYERGSVLVLVPVGFLVLMLLAAMTVDSAAVYLGRQQLHDALDAAVNNAATAALSNASFYGAGKLVIDPSRAAEVVCRTVEVQSDRDLHRVRLKMAVSGTDIEVVGTATVDAVFGRLIPGFGQRPVEAEATAAAVSGPGRPPPPPPGALMPISCGGPA